MSVRVLRKTNRMGLKIVPASLVQLIYQKTHPELRQENDKTRPENRKKSNAYDWTAFARFFCISEVIHRRSGLEKKPEWYQASRSSLIVFSRELVVCTMRLV